MANRRHGEPYTAPTFRQRLKRACVSAGLAERPPYALRHYFGTKQAGAGLNQTIMMALSMVVIAALIGADGLGNPVVQGLNALEIGLATIGGLSIVLLAMVLDRITQGISQK